MSIIRLNPMPKSGRYRKLALKVAFKFGKKGRKRQENGRHFYMQADNMEARPDGITLGARIRNAIKQA